MALCRRAGWQGFLVIADAVFIQERLIDEVFGDHHPRQRGDQRCIGTRTDWDPLVFTSGAGVGIAWVDDDHAGIGFGAGLFEVIGYPAAAHAGFARIITEQHHQLTVFDIRRAVAVRPAAVGVVESRSNLRR